MEFSKDIDPNVKKYTFAVYILQALIFATFLIPVTPIIGVMINYIKQDDAEGSWLQSHFIWQKNTFWYGLLWTILGLLTQFILIGYAVLLIVSIWVMYRIAKGWIYLVDGKQLYQAG